MIQTETLNHLKDIAAQHNLKLQNGADLVEAMSIYRLFKEACSYAVKKTVTVYANSNNPAIVRMIDNLRREFDVVVLPIELLNSK